MSPRGSADGDDDSQLFAGVRFALIGFDPISESQVRLSLGSASSFRRDSMPDCFDMVLILALLPVPFAGRDLRWQYRSEIVRRGGADAGGRGTDCTHVVVCDLVYVSWVSHSDALRRLVVNLVGGSFRGELVHWFLCVCRMIRCAWWRGRMGSRS